MLEANCLDFCYNPSTELSPPHKANEAMEN